MLLIGSCLWDHFTSGILPDDTASILTSFKDITLICGIVGVILSLLPSQTLVAGHRGSSSKSAAVRPL